MAEVLVVVFLAALVIGLVALASARDTYKGRGR
jgi:hypothetical protein